MILVLLPLSYWFVTRRVGSDEVLDATSATTSTSTATAAASAAASKSKRNKIKSKHSNSKVQGDEQQPTTIIEEYRTLVQLSVPNGALSQHQHQQKHQHQHQQEHHRRYGKVRATFCEIDWDLQTANPSTVAMFRDLQAQSSRCLETQTVVLDLYDLVQAAKKYDGYHDDTQSSGNNNSNSNNNKDKDNEVYPTGVVFHETRCGSTLVANLLAGSATEGRSRVYSESPPPIAALKACSNDGDKSCDPDLHKALIRDVFYMMGRRKRTSESENQNQNENEKNTNNAGSSNTEERNRVFYKIQSIGVMAIDKFTMAFPEVPWIFVYRDTVEILQSHLKQGSNSVPKVCTRNYNLKAHQQPATTLQAIRDAGKSLRDLDHIQYCAAHLAGLSLAALNEHDRTATATTATTTTTAQENQQLQLQQQHRGGRFVEYNQLPERLWEEILPNHFGVNPLPKEAIANMQAITGVYSKGRGVKANKEWTEDSTRKQQTASSEVTDAADLFVADVYRRMNELSH